MRHGVRAGMRHSVQLGAMAVLLSSVALCVECAASGKRGGKGDFDPLGFPGDDTIVTSDAKARQVTIDTVATQPAPSRKSPATQDSTTIYRVQFFATTDLAEAEDILSRASRSLKDSVSLSFETPYYKLNAGPFSDHDIAERLVLKLRAMGYESAWVVTERVARKIPSE